MVTDVAGAWWEKYSDGMAEERFDRAAGKRGEFADLPRTRYFVLVMGKYPHVETVTWDIEHAIALRGWSTILTEEEIRSEPEAAPLLAAWEKGDRTNFSLTGFETHLEGVALDMKMMVEYELEGRSDLVHQNRLAVQTGQEWSTKAAEVGREKC